VHLSSAGHDTKELGGLVPVPERGRTFTSRRRVRLSDMDAAGRVRLDAVARYLQDVAIEDVEETGWGLPDHLWFIRHIRVDVVVPFLADRRVQLVTWCSGLAPIAAGRRWSVTGDRGGRIEVDSVWIHLGPDERPARLDGFGIYAEATGGRSVSTKLHLPEPAADAPRLPWPVRVTDVDLHGHLNNAAYWHAIEERLARRGPDPTRPLRALLDYRRPIDVDDEVQVVEWTAGADPAGEDAVHVAFVTSDGAKAVARIEPIAPA
jgi:acyl-ACP thioesterase